MSTLPDTLDAIDAALSVLAPLIVLAPGNHAGQGATSFPATATAKRPTPGAPAPVTVYTIEAPRTVNRNLDREGISPHLMVEHEIVITLTTPVNITDSTAARRALMNAEESVIGAIYGKDFARVHRLTFGSTSRSPRPDKGSALVSVLTFNQKP